MKLLLISLLGFIIYSGTLHNLNAPYLVLFMIKLYNTETLLLKV